MRLKLRAHVAPAPFFTYADGEELKNSVNRLSVGFDSVAFLSEPIKGVKNGAGATCARSFSLTLPESASHGNIDYKFKR